MLLASLFAARTVSAQGNYRSTPIGGRTTLMGGTGLAYGRDGAAAFMNPATVLEVDDNRLAFSVNFYTFTAVSARSWYQPGPIDRTHFGDLDVDDATMTDLEFNALPSSLCLFVRMSSAEVAKKKIAGSSRLGFCLATTAANTFTFAAEDYKNGGSNGLLTRQAQTVLQTFSRFSIGPTYAAQLTDALSFGLSLHGSLVSQRSLLASTATTYGSRTPVSTALYSGNRGDSFQLHALAGLTYRIGRATLALAVEAPSLHVFGVGAANLYTHFDAGAGAITRSTSVSGDFLSRTPLRVGVGSGIVTSRASAEINVNVYAPMASAYRAQLSGAQITVQNGAVTEAPMNATFQQGAAGVVNVTLGGEYFLYPSLSILGGLGTDFSAVPSNALRGDLFNYYPARSHRFATSFGIGSHGEGGDLLIGTELSYAFGHRLAINSYQAPPDFGRAAHGTFVVLFVVAGSTTLKTIARAWEDVGAAVKGKAPPHDKK